MGKRNRQNESTVQVVPLLEPAHRTAVDAAIERHRARPGALLPILHDIQSALGHIPEGAAAPVAQALSITRADFHGVVSFYHDFRAAPPGRHVLRICSAEACQAMGARRLEAHAQRRLGLKDGGHDTPDGQFTLEPAYCLGNCALSPSMLLDGELHGRVTPERFDALVAACRAEAAA